MPFLNFTFVGNSDAGKIAIIRKLIFDQRLSVADLSLNIFTDHQYPTSLKKLYRFPDDDFSAFVELDGEVHGLHIRNGLAKSDLFQDPKKSPKRRDNDAFIAVFSFTAPLIQSDLRILGFTAEAVQSKSSRCTCGE